MIEYVVWGINPEPWRTPGVPRRGHPVKDGKLQAYQDALKEELPEQNPRLRMHDGYLTVEFFFWRSTKFNMPADATNCQKATEDALQGVLYVNDKHNRKVSSEIVEQSPETEPLIIIRISEWDPTVVPPVPRRKVTGKFQDDLWKPPKEDMF